MAKNYIVKKIVDLPLFSGAVQGTEFVAFQDPSTFVTYRIEASKIGGADKLVKDFSTLDDATLPLSGTDLVAIWDGTANKKVTVGNFAGGHVFEDSTDTVLPTRSVAKAGAGIEFEDDGVGEKTVVKLKEYIQPISFAITDTFTFKPAYNLSITSADISSNITDLRVGKNGAAPATMTFPYTIAAVDILTFKVSFTDAYGRELSSFITLIGQYL